MGCSTFSEVYPSVCLVLLPFQVPSLKDNPTIEHYIYFAMPIQEVNMRDIGICFNAVDCISKAENLKKKKTTAKLLDYFG